jgi:hypothetical protein
MHKITVGRRPDQPVLAFFVRERLNTSWARLSYKLGHRMPLDDAKPELGEPEYGPIATVLAERVSGIDGVGLLHVDGYELVVLYAPSYTTGEIMRNVAAVIGEVLEYDSYDLVNVRDGQKIELAQTPEDDDTSGGYV